MIILTKFNKMRHVLYFYIQSNLYCLGKCFFFLIYINKKSNILLKQTSKRIMVLNIPIKEISLLILFNIVG